VLDVHQDQLLMLLLVMQAEFDYLPAPSRTRLDQLRHGLGDVATVGHDLIDPGPGDQAALRSRMPGANAFVVRVEEIIVGRIEDAVAPRIRPQHEGLEEPGRVGEMPLGGADVGHGLHGLVFRRQGRGKVLRLLTHGQEAKNQRSISPSWPGQQTVFVPEWIG
jgi:hypothetical protein